MVWRSGQAFLAMPGQLTGVPETIVVISESCDQAVLAGWNGASSISGGW